MAKKRSKVEPRSMYLVMLEVEKTPADESDLPGERTWVWQPLTVPVPFFEAVRIRDAFEALPDNIHRFSLNPVGPEFA